MPDESASRLRPFVELLRKHDVEFIVIGGQAESLMGSPRATFDTDLCYRQSPQNFEKLATALKELKVSLRNAPVDLPFILDERTLALGSNFTFDTPHGALDLLAWVEPIGTFDAVCKNAESIMFFGSALNIIGLNDLIRVKRHIRRGKDKESLFQLLAIQEQRRQTGNS